ncbi:MAG: hypothetical protein ACRD4L_00835, partial [Pyrinomonadaceae bacterium]
PQVLPDIRVDSRLKILDPPATAGGTDKSGMGILPMNHGRDARATTASGTDRSSIKLLNR